MADPADRFAGWPPLPARLLLMGVLLLLIAAALTPIDGEGPAVAPRRAAAPIPAAAATTRDADLALYDRIIARVARGEDYYAVAVDEQRRGDYPVRPGPAVRLPTLAHVSALLGDAGVKLAAATLFALTIGAWWRRLGVEPGGRPRRLMAVALLIPGAALMLNAKYLVLHEIWAGMLLLLSLGLHRAGVAGGRRWVASLIVAALALAIRELALPFILLMATMAAVRRHWREAAGWSALAIAFAALLFVHIGLIAPHVGPADPPSPSWLAVRGLPGWLSNIAQSSSLHFLPFEAAGPLVLLMLLGWAGWRAPAADFATLLYLGYGLMFMLVGRANNFYWGALVAPGMFMGLAFLPRAVRSLWRAAWPSGR